MVVVTWTLVSSFGSAVRGGDGHLSNVAPLLKDLLATKAWRSFTPPGGEPVTHESFVEFLEAKPTKGVGADYATVRRLLADDVGARDLLDEAVQRPAHRHADVDNVNVRPSGNARDQALRRLRKDAPDLHCQVIAGELTPHAAMIQAGLRPRTATIRVDTVEHAVTGLLRHFTADQIRTTLNDQP